MKRETWFVVVGLTGANEASFRTRENAALLAKQWNEETDFDKQDADDCRFCLRHGLPFLRRRYFVTTEERDVRHE